jgi:hypothetical protein
MMSVYIHTYICKYMYVYRLPRLNVDEWSTNEDLTKAWALATQLLKDKNGMEGSARSMKESDCLDIEFGGKVDETLCGHASFTLSLLERLCFVLSDSGLLDHLPESLGAIADAKALHAETFALKDRVTKLTAEIIDMRVRLHESEQQKTSAEKALDRSSIESRKATNGTSSDMVANSSSSGDGGVGPPEDTRTSPLGSSSDSKEVLLKIATLEKQLAESEGAKARAEMTLTERLARPLSQTEAQVTDMRRAMEDLRQQGRQRVSSLISEGK